MPIRKQYIPKQDDDFFTFQGNLVNIVVTNAVAWGIPAPSVAALVTRRAEYEPLYWTAQNKTTRNRTDVLLHRQMRETYETEIRTFVRKYGEIIPPAGRNDIGLTDRDTEPTPRGKINDVPYVKLTAMGGGDIRVRVTVEEDQTKSSMHTLADAIECRYLLVPKGEMPPEGQKNAKTTVVSKKALFIISCGDEQAGETFWGFFRWVNLTNPANSGQWSNSLKVVIS